MGPQNALPPDTGDYGTRLPTTDPVEQDLTVERNMAKFSKTKEFLTLKKVIEARIKHHTKYSPGAGGSAGVAFRDMPNEERGYRTLAADLVIEELEGIISAYEQATDIVKDADGTTK